MDINDYRTKYTKEEFVEEIQKGSTGKIQTTKNCPISWNLAKLNCLDYNNDCESCWSDALKNIQFKGEEDEIIEDFNNNFCFTFNVNDFKNKDITIQCETEKEAKQLFDIFIKNGIQKWGMGEVIDYSSNPCWCENDTVYEYDKGIYVGDIKQYYDYEIYKFSNIDFTHIYNKDSINEVALNNKVEEFDITKAKYITKEQLDKRGYKNGDLLFDGTSMAIVYGNNVLHINANDVEKLFPKAFDKIIPVESIERNIDIQRALSRKFSGVTQYFKDIEDYFIKIKERDTITTNLYQVEFTYDSSSLKNFISDDSDIEIGDVVECCLGLTSSNYQYCRVKNIIEEELTKDEIKLYRKCRKLSN